MALTGASQIIKKYNPVLAICLYHSLEDYYKLPLLIKHLYPGYKLFVRHYTDMVDAETVCYAIPE
ncbi:FkbM family methyltransferase [Metabacillus sp. B2-18]|uniref:FkbM family methyltransferase n=1 Tax=Metabacillus sp. B2-18 TaxID=2897333 RepID=UPI001E57227E|nr:FkbM family methyltransferase [Metabacillus sp. B2-18]UGB30420.1 FkbM family methyltransferase [Metabacillus sp. B2-18]